MQSTVFVKKNLQLPDMTRTSPLLQDHTEYNATGMDVRNSMQLTDVVKLRPHRWPHLALCLFSN